MAANEKRVLGELSHAEKILISFFKVSHGTVERVTFEDLVLQAWNDFPSDFSLPNHPEYPDASVISKRLYSNLITNRLVVSLKNRVYRLTEKGVADALVLLNPSISTDNGDKVTQDKIILNRDEKLFLDSALRSKPFYLWKAGNKEELIDYDVRVFFQFSTGTSVKERKRRVETAKEAMKKAVLLKLQDSEELKNLFDFLVHEFPQLFEEK